MDIAQQAYVLAVLASMPMLAWCCTAFVEWRRRREAETVERRQVEAERKAQSMLREILTEGELRQLSERHYLAIRSPHVTERSYLVYPSPGRPVDVYESGSLVARLCVQPLKQLPVSDLLALHKLMIEGDELHYLQEANVLGTTVL